MSRFSIITYIPLPISSRVTVHVSLFPKQMGVVNPKYLYPGIDFEILEGLHTSTQMNIHSN